MRCFHLIFFTPLLLIPWLLVHTNETCPESPPSSIYLLEQAKQAKDRVSPSPSPSTPVSCPGNSKSVIALSLWTEDEGSNVEKFATNAIHRFAHAADLHYPGWPVWLYFDASVSEDVLNVARAHEWVMKYIDHVDYPAVYNKQGTKQASKIGALWRFDAVDDASIERVILRDLDSPPISREASAVCEWISSGRFYHVMRDCPLHCIPMLGGMWGAVTGQLHMAERMKKHNWMKLGFKGGDQWLLRTSVWQDIQHSLIQHDAYCCEIYPHNTQPFPIRRDPSFAFVGEEHDAQGAPECGDGWYNIRLVESPAKCRADPKWESG